MPLHKWIEQSTPLPGAPGIRQVDVTPEAWLACAADAAAGGGRLLASWADCARGNTIFAALIAEPSVLLLSLELPGSSATYPSLTDAFPVAGRMQRATADLPRSDNGQHTVRVTATGAREYPSAYLTHTPPTLSVACTFKVQSS